VRAASSEVNFFEMNTVATKVWRICVKLCYAGGAGWGSTRLWRARACQGSSPTSI